MSVTGLTDEVRRLITHNDVPKNKELVILKFCPFVVFVDLTKAQLKEYYREIREDMLDRNRQETDYYHHIRMEICDLVESGQTWTPRDKETRQKLCYACVSWNIVEEEEKEDFGDDVLVAIFKRNTDGEVTYFERVPRGGFKQEKGPK